MEHPMNAARFRLAESKRLRRNDKRRIDNGEMWHQITQAFLFAFKHAVEGEDSAITIKKLQKAIALLLSNTKITAENIQSCENATQRWREYLDPLYNALRLLITKTKERGDRKQVSAFWSLALSELQQQLNEIASAANIIPEALGSLDIILGSEIRK